MRRFGRGRYGPGWMPRGTEHRIHKRVQALRAEIECVARGPAHRRALRGRWLSLRAGRPPTSDNP
ncbi:hypothetical protein C1Y40_02476 [Mycobacterium talmoniae]|uniref:Uncharacterized protein n=1 Tax=Mycobacterium talmoniae TaxID=1858794 RepID=A0A2S8BKX9_9MYCO|nr:hypothetical protein C1Y40_02476 [Mycobacterium talmoniae]